MGRYDVQWKNYRRLRLAHRIGTWGFFPFLFVLEFSPYLLYFRSVSNHSDLRFAFRSYIVPLLFLPLPQAPQILCHDLALHTDAVGARMRALRPAKIQRRG